MMSTTPHHTNKSTPCPDDYSDIINLPRRISKTHPPMPKSARAAQFAPYAALVGHRDIISGEEQIACAKADIDHEITIELDRGIDEDYAISEYQETFNYPEITDNPETADADFSQENPLDS